MTAIARAETILAVDKTQLELSKSTAEKVHTKLAALPCSTPEQEQSFADFLTRTKEALRQLEEERENLVRPLIDDKAEIDKLYRAPRQAWETVEKTIKGKLAAAQEARRLAVEDARQAAIEAAQAGETEACAAALATVNAHQPVKVAGASTQWEWTYEVMDLASIPREYLSVSEFALKSHMSGYKKSETIPEIPGVKFTRRAKVVAR